MKWLRVPVLVVLLMPSCSLMVQDAEYFDGEWQSPGVAGMRSDSAAGDSSAAADGGAAGASAADPPGTAGGAGDEGAVGGANGAAGDPSSGGTTNTSGGAAPANPCDNRNALRTESRPPSKAVELAARASKSGPASARPTLALGERGERGAHAAG